MFDCIALEKNNKQKTPDPVAQSVVKPTAAPGVTSLVPAWSHTFLKVYHEIMSTVILILQLIQEGLLSDTSESMSAKYWLTA